MSPDGQRYQDLCNYILKKSKGKAAVLIVLEGTEGDGYAVAEQFGVDGGQGELLKLLRRVTKQVAHAKSI